MRVLYSVSVDFPGMALSLGVAPLLVGDGGGNPIYWPDESTRFSSPLATGSTGGGPHQDLPLELIRHYTDLLRIMAERIAGAVPHAAAVAAPAAPLPSGPRVEAPSEGDAPSWEAALDLLHSREWTQECVVALWLQHRYVLATHVVLAVGVTLDGHRRILGLVESTPEDVERIAAFLYALQARGVGAESGLLCTVPSGGALRRAAVTVWGSDLALQRCLLEIQAKLKGAVLRTFTRDLGSYRMPARLARKYRIAIQLPTRRKPKVSFSTS